MAIQKDYEITIHGKNVMFEDAYIAIESVNGDKNSMGLVVGIYDGRERVNKIKVFSHFFIPNVSDDADNIYKQGYNNLKNQPKFIGAIDILEEGQLT